MLFGPAILFEFFIHRAFLSSYSPTFISKWLQKHQSTFLWTQLFYSLSISVACCVRQYQVSCSYYEAATITQVIGITTIGLSLALTAVYQRIERMPVLISAFLATLILGAIAVIAPSSTTKRFNGLLQACSDASKDMNLPWGSDATQPYNNEVEFPELFSDIALILTMDGIWGYLWLRRDDWMEGKKVITLVEIFIF